VGSVVHISTLLLTQFSYELLVISNKLRDFIINDFSSIFYTKKAIHLPLIESLRLLAIFLLKKFALKIRTNILKCNIQTSNENYISIVLTKDQNPLLVQQKMENKL